MNDPEYPDGEPLLACDGCGGKAVEMAARNEDLQFCRACVARDIEESALAYARECELMPQDERNARIAADFGPEPPF